MEIKILNNTIAYIGQGIGFPEVVEISTPLEQGSDLPLTFTVIYSHVERRYVLRKTQIGAADSHVEITGQLIRSIPFQEILQAGLKKLRFFDTHTQELSPTTALNYRPENRDQLIKQGPVKQSLETVALLYRIAEVLNVNQGKHVERALNIPYATAANWISRARSHGAFEAFEDSKNMFIPAGSNSKAFKTSSFIADN